jgi:hypothetical protein
MARIIILDTRVMLKPIVAALLVACAVSAIGRVQPTASASKLFNGAATPGVGSASEGGQADQTRREQDWPFYGGDQGGCLPPLTDISPAPPLVFGGVGVVAAREGAEPVRHAPAFSADPLS